jgi:23S rRNA (cytidine1920-2'-O)/16S rRNA (cytidine1409-2'-O)-methyltransferase
MKKKKVRIDNLMVERGLAPSRSRAQALLMAGKVLLGTTRIDKPGTQVDPECELTLKEELPYVGRGGLKLAGFLDEAGVDPRGLVTLDVGSSTGGFTDCLLQRGAEKVYAVDVGKALMEQRLRDDPRVHLIEGRNVRYLEAAEIGEKVDLVVIDVSFISLEKVLPVIKGFVKGGGHIAALVKPQFEVGRGEVGKGGIVRDPDKHRAVMERIKEFSIGEGLTPLKEAESAIKGAKGNKEFWIYLEV